MCSYWIGLTRGITLQHLNLCSQLRHHSKLNFMTLCCTYVIQHRFVHKLQRRVRVRKHCSLTLVSYAKAQNPCLGQPRTRIADKRSLRQTSETIFIDDMYIHVDTCTCTHHKLLTNRRKLTRRRHYKQQSSVKGTSDINFFEICLLLISDS